MSNINPIDFDDSLLDDFVSGETLKTACRSYYKHTAFDSSVNFIKDWSEVTEDFLHKKYEEFLSRDWDYSKIRASWWAKEFS